MGSHRFEREIGTVLEAGLVIVGLGSGVDCHPSKSNRMSRPAFEQFTAQPPQPAGEFVAQQQTVQGEAMAAQGQELTIAKLENSVANMEEQQLTSDPRYQKMLQLKSKLTGAPPPAEPAQQPSPSVSQQQQQITPAQLNQLRAQVGVKRIQNRVGLRIRELSNLPADLPPNLRIKAEIELRALRLVNLQAQV
ncbi:unnamed protein product [Strongylus vulgaris]|uniref:QLQ domain-containing protein n=1 Tax=Strongylus vulgaris TaxID=40348 RepID=A0A3P7LBG7_STRVU|nr:unnamed protein product [Strongylus vulgaris]